MAKNGDGERPSKKVEVSEVQLKLVGESLEVIKDYSQKLKLECICEDKGCKVSFSNGKIEINKIS